jgi:hypothetical protein
MPWNQVILASASQPVRADTRGAQIGDVDPIGSPSDDRGQAPLLQREQDLAHA